MPFVRTPDRPASPGYAPLYRSSLHQHQPAGPGPADRGAPARGLAAALRAIAHWFVNGIPP